MRRLVVVLAFVALSLLAFVLLLLADTLGLHGFGGAPVLVALCLTGVLGGLMALGMSKLLGSAPAPAPGAGEAASLMTDTFDRAGLGTFELNAELEVVRMSRRAASLLSLERPAEPGEAFEAVVGALEHGGGLLREVHRCRKSGECGVLLPGDLALVGSPTPNARDGRMVFILGRLRQARPIANASHDTDKHALAVLSGEASASGHGQLVDAAEGPAEALVANVSHELRTPLVSIRGYGELLRRGDLGEMNAAQLKALETIIRNLDRQVAMIDNLLEYSRLARHRETLKPGRFDIAGLGRDVVDMLRPRAQEVGVSLRLRRLTPDNVPLSSSTPLFVFADQLKVTQVMTNLLSNAIKFTDRGGKVRLYIRDASDAEASRLDTRVQRARVHQIRRSGEWASPRQRGGWLLVRVQDTGCGIPKELLAKVFDRFFTRAGEKQERSGTGLGLSITDEIVRLHDGVIEVNSDVGVGSVFSVWLPIGEAVPVEVPAPSNVTPLPTRESARQPVMVVDDEPDIANFARLVLENAGYSVVVASTAGGAMELLGRVVPKVVVMDYSLPDGNGLELLTRVRSTEGLGELPVVMVSARSDDAVRQKCLAAGAYDFLVKPYGIDELTQLVAAAIAAAAPAGEVLGRVVDL